MTNASASSSVVVVPAARSRRDGGAWRWKRIALRGTGAVALAVGVIGLLHMPVAAPLLRMISPASLCPVTKGSAAQIDRGHALGAANLRATATGDAKARPALGFTLDATKRADIDAWAKANGISCGAINGNENLRRCVDVPAHAVGAPESLGALEEVTFELRATGELVNVQSMRRKLTGEQAVTVATTLDRGLEEALGAATKVGGKATATHLESGRFATYVTERTFRDYSASITATNLAPTGVMVREQYMSLRP